MIHFVSLEQDMLHQAATASSPAPLACALGHSRAIYEHKKNESALKDWYSILDSQTYMSFLLALFG